MTDKILKAACRCDELGEVCKNCLDEKELDQVFKAENARIEKQFGGLKAGGTWDWTRETVALPKIAQPVLLIRPGHNTNSYWLAHVACILVRHEDVTPHPINIGDEMPSDFYWSPGFFSTDVALVTGDGYWAPLNNIALPDGLEHKQSRGRDYIMSAPPITGAV